MFKYYCSRWYYKSLDLIKDLVLLFLDRDLEANPFATLGYPILHKYHNECVERCLVVGFDFF